LRATVPGVTRKAKHLQLDRRISLFVVLASGEPRFIGDQERSRAHRASMKISLARPGPALSKAGCRIAAAFLTLREGALPRGMSPAQTEHWLSLSGDERRVEYIQNEIEQTWDEAQGRKLDRWPFLKPFRHVDPWRNPALLRPAKAHRQPGGEQRAAGGLCRAWRPDPRP
jgi:hypothetical protein